MSISKTQQRRDLTIACKYRNAFFTMRFCKFCLSYDVSCRVNREHLTCEKCYRTNRKCDLTSDYKGMNEAIAKAEKLNNEITELRLKIARKSK